MNTFEFFDRPIAFHRCLAALTGSINAGLMLGQAIYWTKRSSSKDGWFYKTIAEWHDETYLTRDQQKIARKILLTLRDETGMSVWEERRSAMPARMYFRVNAEPLFRLLTFRPPKKLDNAPFVQFAGNPQTRLRETRKQDCGKPANNTLYMQRLHAETTHTFFPREVPATARTRAGKKYVFFNSFSDLIECEAAREWIKEHLAETGLNLQQATDAFVAYHQERHTEWTTPTKQHNAWQGWMIEAKRRHLREITTKNIYDMLAK